MSDPSHSQSQETPGPFVTDDAGERSAARRRQLRLLLAALVPVVAIAALLIWGTVRSGGRPGGVFVNSQGGEVGIDSSLAPDFALTLFDGRTTRLSDYRGKVVMIDFWSSWCVPCRLESPALAAVYRSFRDRPVEFIGVNVWDDEGAARDFVIREQLDYPNGIDSSGRIPIDYGVFGIPEKFFVNPEGQIVRKYVGPVDEERLTRILNELLDGG